jgi:nickel transport protein
MKTLQRFALTAALAAISAPALAHDIVLVPQGQSLVVRYGHPKDWQPMEKRRLIELVALDGAAAPRDLEGEIKPRGLDFVISRVVHTPGQAVLLAARYDNGLWARLPKVGEAKQVVRNTTRVMLPQAESVTNNLKFAKALMPAAADTETYKRTLGHLLELVPQANPAALKSGEMLPVLVLYQGKPLAGAGIELGNMVDAMAEAQIKRYVTGADGIAQVPLRAKGIQMLGVDHEQLNDGTLGAAAKAVGADKFVLVATYTFVR